MSELPFTVEEFFQVFAAYNQAVWPTPLVLVLGAVGVLALLRWPPPWADRAIAGYLAVLWAWTGIAYHLLHFTAINGAAYVFAGLFVVQAVLFGWLAVAGTVTFDVRLDARGVVGGFLVAYALLLYPVALQATGHGYPAMPTFGAPCPVVIFTFGMLLLTRGRVPGWLLVIPFAWGLVGASAVLALGVLPDAMLTVSALAATPMILRRNRASAGSGKAA